MDPPALARFRRILLRRGVPISEDVIRVIRRSAWLSARLSSVGDDDSALELATDAAAVPRSETRAVVLRVAGIAIDGELPFVGAQTAMFFYAFQDSRPMVLKVPHQPLKAKIESALIAAVLPDGSAAAPAGVFLVPVRYLGLEGRHVAHGDTKPLRAGLIMPHYACTLANVPTPVAHDFARQSLRRLTSTLDHLQRAGWMHGDVKPGNIFLDAAGDVYLGDFGSSVQLRDARYSYPGGTPLYQCADIGFATHTDAFDRACLAVTFVTVLGLVPKGRAPYDGWPRDGLIAAITRGTDTQGRAVPADLCEALLQLLEEH